jgi:hypothetical protein
LKAIQPAIDVLSSHVALLDAGGMVVAVNEAWRAFSEGNGGCGDYVGYNYLEVCRRAADEGSKSGAGALAGLKRVLGGGAWDFGLAYECHGAIFRLRAVPIASDHGRQILVSHENITALVDAKRATRAARAGDARLAEELGQRLAAIGLALHVLKREGANPKAIRIIDLALEEARHELKLLRRGRDDDG